MGSSGPPAAAAGMSCGSCAVAAATAGANAELKYVAILIQPLIPIGLLNALALPLLGWLVHIPNSAL